MEAPHHGIGRDGKDGQPAPPEYEARFPPAAVDLRGNVPPHLEQKARSKLAGYYAMIANLDHNVGRVLDWLEENGLAASTLVAFFSDHGELAGSHGFLRQVPSVRRGDPDPGCCCGCRGSCLPASCTRK